MATNHLRQLYKFPRCSTRSVVIENCKLMSAVLWHTSSPRTRQYPLVCGCTKISTMVLSTPQKTNPFPLFTPPPTTERFFRSQFPFYRLFHHPARHHCMFVSELRVMCIFTPHLRPRYSKTVTFRI